MNNLSKLAPFSRRGFCGLAVGGGAAVFLVACAFNQIYGVSQLSEEVVTGLMETNEEGDRVYVGTIYSGDRWDAIARVRAINPATGAQTGSAPLYSGSHRYRAVAEDTSDNTTWLLRDNGTLDHRSVNLGFISSSAGFFTAPAGGSLERFCDLEQLPNSHYVATGVYTSNGAQRGFFSYVQPHPAIPGSWYRSWRSYPLSPGADIDESCPRVSHETNTSETLVLMPNAYHTGSAHNRVSRYEGYSWNGGGGNIYHGLSSLGYWTKPVSSKWLPGDISVEFDAVAIAWQHTTDLSSGYLQVYDQATGALDDTRNLERARAIDFALWSQISNDASSLLWWGGYETDTGSSFELGVFSFVN